MVGLPTQPRRSFIDRQVIARLDLQRLANLAWNRCPLLVTVECDMV